MARPIVYRTVPLTILCRQGGYYSATRHARPIAHRIVRSYMNTESLLLAADTRVTCPACGQEFSLEEGFAKQALDAVAIASASALAALKDQERAAVEKRAQQLAGEQSKAAQRQIENMQAMLKAQAAVERQEYEKQLADSRVQLKGLRDEQLALREERQMLKDEKDTLALRSAEAGRRQARRAGFVGAHPGAGKSPAGEGRAAKKAR